MSINPLNRQPRGPRGVIPGTGSEYDEGPTRRSEPSNVYDELAEAGVPSDGRIEVPSNPFVPPHLRVRKAPTAGLTGAQPLLEVVEPWHAVLGSEAVDSALAALTEAVTRADEAAAAVRSIEVDKATEPDKIAKAVRAGDEPPSATDWPVEEAQRLRAWDEAYSAAKDAQHEYLTVTAAESHRLIPEVRARASRERKKAADALRRVRGAVETAVASGDAVSRYASLTGAYKGERGVWRTRYAGLPASLLPHLDAVIEALGLIEDDGVLNGALLDDPTPAVVPDCTRAALYHSQKQSDLGTLEQIEAYEHQQGDRRSDYEGRRAERAEVDVRYVRDRLRQGLLP